MSRLDYLAPKSSQNQKNQGKNDRVTTFFYVEVFRWTRLIFFTFYLSGLGSIVYDVCCPCLSQYTALVPIGCHFSFSWNDIFLSVPFVLRYLPENCQCWLATHCKYTISY